MMVISLFFILGMLCLLYSNNYTDKYLIFITILFTSLSPLIRVVLDIGDSNYFIYYAFIEILYIVVIGQFCTNGKVFLILLCLGIISSIYNLYEWAYFSSFTYTYEYNQLINKVLYTYTVLTILGSSSIKFMLAFILLSESYNYMWKLMGVYFT